jgi:TolA-binding protein
MKSKQRHQLKENQFAATVGRGVQALTDHRDRIVIGLVAAALIAAIAGGYYFWNRRSEDRANAAFGNAMAMTQSPIVPAPTVPGAQQAPGTYPTEQARTEAAVKAFRDVVDQYPSTTAARGARYHIGALLLSANRAAEAEAAFRQAIDDGGATIYASVSHLGLAEALVNQGKYDEGIRVLNDLVGNREGDLPIDAILMRLGYASIKAGRAQEARAFFRRVADEFPQSPFAAEAKQKQ